MFCHTTIKEIPRKDFVISPRPCRVEGNVNSTFFKGLHPDVILIILTPGIIHTTLFISTQDCLIQLPVAPGQNAFQNTYIRFMPVIFDALLVQLTRNCGSGLICFIKELLLRALGCPLEGCKRFRDKEGSTGYNLYPSVSLFLWNRLIKNCRNFIGQFCYSSDILRCLCGKPQHEVKLNSCPSAFKGKSGAFKYDFFGQPLIYHIS